MHSSGEIEGTSQSEIFHPFLLRRGCRTNLSQDLMGFEKLVFTHSIRMSFMTLLLSTLLRFNSEIHLTFPMLLTIHQSIQVMPTVHQFLTITHQLIQLNLLTTKIPLLIQLNVLMPIIQPSNH